MGVSDCFTQDKKCSLVVVSLLYLNIATHSKEHKESQFEVSINKLLRMLSCVQILYEQLGSAGSHTTVCSKLAQLILRKGHSHADSQVHSQAGSQAYRCLGWCDHEVGVGVGVRFGVKFVVKVGVSE